MRITQYSFFNKNYYSSKQLYLNHRKLAPNFFFKKKLDFFWLNYFNFFWPTNFSIIKPLYNSVFIFKDSNFRFFFKNSQNTYQIPGRFVSYDRKKVIKL